MCPDQEIEAKNAKKSANIGRSAIAPVSPKHIERHALHITQLMEVPSWGETDRRVVARIEATSLGLDIRFVVTSLKAGSAEHVYDTLYCARGQAENLIKLHKAQLKSDRTSCRSANANQMRLFLHTAAYWLMWRLRQALPQSTALRAAEFATIRLRLIKVAARVIETATRIRIAFASACPDAKLFRHVALSLRAASP